jgi:ELWxxDGT repeat protein
VWRTDGTAQGTRQLGSIPGSAVLLAASEDERSPRFLNAYVDGGLHELWSFTPGGGAVRLAGPFASIDSSALAGAKLVFSATTTGDPAVREPWVSDGTVSGTRRVSAAGVGGLSGARVWCAAGSFAYITASEPGTGSEMWRTDGTASGTRRMTDIAAGPASSNPHGAVIVNNRLYFAATDGSNTEDLWQIDLCPADFNNNHVLSVQDIFDFLTAYFAGDPRANVGGVDQVSVQDLMDWLAMWFGGCG